MKTNLFLNRFFPFVSFNIKWNRKKINVQRLLGEVMFICITIHMVYVIKKITCKYNHF